MEFVSFEAITIKYYVCACVRLCVCLYSCLTYLTCKSHIFFCPVLSCSLWPGCLYHIFPRYLIKGTIFGTQVP